MRSHLIVLSLVIVVAGCGSSSGSSSSSSRFAGSAAPASTGAPRTSNPGGTTPSTAMTVTGITPDTGGAGVTVTITGANFANLTGVTVGGVSLTNATYNST